MAVDGAGHALASADPTATAATWSLTPIDVEQLTGVSCGASGLCVAVDDHGEALASDDPAAPTPVWVPSNADPGVPARSLAGVSCLPGGFCIALDTTGHALTARVSAPVASTLTPTEVTSTGAILAGSVDPEDAVLGGCSFEYGTSLPYTQLLPCSALPMAVGGVQDVSAQVSGLSPNTTYHYRVLASSPAGAGSGADETFTTATSSQVAIVHPSPSLTGTPANGQLLTCHPGTPEGSSAQLTYAWLRDLIPIAGATGSTYTVKGQDTGHHLQCQVTATDGGGSATAKSAFVTIPVGGVPVSAGETAVGRATFRSGKLSVPITCSTQASGGCEVVLRLTAVETLSGTHIVAIAARSGHGAHATGASPHHATVTLASVRVHLDRGSHATVVAVLGTSARRLLDARRHFSAYLHVSGTVIGVIEAQLSQQLIALNASAHSASTGAVEAQSDGEDTGRHASATAASVLAATPYMGWDTYFAFGGRYSEATILQQASELISLGLEKRGYRYVWLDVGWWHGTRNASGEITVSPTQWPHGLAWLTRTLHAAGLLVGLYTDAGPERLRRRRTGQLRPLPAGRRTRSPPGASTRSRSTSAAAPNTSSTLPPPTPRSTQRSRRNASHRPMLLSICDFLQPEQYGEGRPVLGESAFSSYSFGPSVGNSWRTDTDVGAPGNVSFTDVLRNIDADAAAPQAAGPGHWNDPDYLAPDQGMSAAQFRSQFSMWAMLAAPLMISDDLDQDRPREPRRRRRTPK